MSKQSEAKERQGYMESGPRCEMCQCYRSDKTIFQRFGQNYTEERNLRCVMGGFKILKRGWCTKFTPKTF